MQLSGTADVMPVYDFYICCMPAYVCCEVGRVKALHLAAAIYS
jgi:hypothetical protein